MSPDITQDLERLLVKIAEKIDIPESRFLQAKERYEAVGKWLQRSESIIAKFNPEVYTQGSFRLGTVIKPISGEEYDIDLVCELNLTKKILTQKKLKDFIGYEIHKYAKANNMANLPEEGKRCWTLNYANGAQFHMDILPSIPDGKEFELLLESKSIKNQWAIHAIAITDNTNTNYQIISDDWPRSNPKGYSEWFKERMRSQYDNQRIILAEAYRNRVEDVPEYKIKTTLQRAIQILKRHRDIMFTDDQDNKPISIIITTLAAHAYKNEDSLLATLQNIVNEIPKHIEKREDGYWVSNPVNPLENFADKWNDYPKRQENFFKWLSKVHSDLSSALGQNNVSDIGEQLKELFGAAILNEVMQDIGSKSIASIPTSALYRSGVLSFFNVPHRQKPRWPISLKGTVVIRAFALQNGFRETTFRSDSQPLPKHLSLRFEAETDVSWPYKVYWQIVNTGREAEVANSLRGEFNEGHMERGKKHKENSLYTGKHWVECFIVKNGECVARSGEFVVNIA